MYADKGNSRQEKPARLESVCLVTAKKWLWGQFQGLLVMVTFFFFEIHWVAVTGTVGIDVSDVR